MRLYHATLLSNLKTIQTEGLRAGSYWTADLDLLDYYIAAVEEEEGQGLEEAAVLTVELDAMVKIAEGAGKALLPDYPGIQEPITGALGRSEADILEDWETSDKGWQDCLAIVQSLKCPVAIEPAALAVFEVFTDEIVPIEAHLAELEAHGAKRRRIPS